MGTDGETLEVGRSASDSIGGVLSHVSKCGDNVLRQIHGSSRLRRIIDSRGYTKGY